MCCYSMRLKPRGVRVHRMCEWEVGGVGGSPDKLLVSSLNRTQGAWQAWRRGAVWVSIVRYNCRTERGKKPVPYRWTGYVQLWQFTRTSDNCQQVLRKRRDCLCFINCHREEISKCWPKCFFTAADAFELCALVCRDLLRLMTFPRLVSCYTVFEITSLRLACGPYSVSTLEKEVAKILIFFRCFTQPLLGQCLSLHVQFVVSLEFPKSWQSLNTCVAPTALTST